MLSDYFNGRNEMTELTQNRINFLEHLHDAFLKKTGHGAFAHISISDAMSLFDKYLTSSESTDLFISRFIHSI
jgi:hypothetical protein